MHNEELHDLYRSPNTVRIVVQRRWLFTLGEHVVKTEEITSAHKIFAVKLLGMCPLVKLRSMDLMGDGEVVGVDSELCPVWKF